jgi:hypothetical protein
MFKNKRMKTINKQVVVEPKVSNPSIHMVDANMAITKNNVIEEHVFKDRKLIKKKFFLTRKNNKDYNNLLLKLYMRCKQRTHYKI